MSKPLYWLVRDVDRSEAEFSVIGGKATKLTLAENAVLLVVVLHLDREGVTRRPPSVDTLMRESTLSDRGVRNAVAGLQAKGILTIRRMGPHPSVYTLNRAALEAAPSVDERPARRAALERQRPARRAALPKPSGDARPARGSKRPARRAAKTGTSCLSHQMEGSLKELEGTRESPHQAVLPIESSTETSKPPKSRASTERRKPETPVPPSDATAAELAAWCVGWGIPDPTVNVEAAKFIDHWRRDDRRFRDWGAAWRNWDRKAGEFTGGRSSTSVRSVEPPEWKPPVREGAPATEAERAAMRSKLAAVVSDLQKTKGTLPDRRSLLHGKGAAP